MKHIRNYSILNTAFCIVILLLVQSCKDGNLNNQAMQAEAVQAEVLMLHPGEAVVEQAFPASIQGKENVQLRPQISGYIDKIYADEGAFVKAGQPLFRINANVYQEQKNTAIAALGMAKSQLASARLELDKYKVLSENKVVADFQYRKAKTNYENALAAVKQQQALVASADLNLGFSVIKAPVSGYIGRIPNRIGALVSPNDTQALTTLSQVSEIYVYFSLPEKEILNINASRPGKTLIEKLKSFQDITLLLADGKPYTHTGKIDMMDGQFDPNTGSVSLRASFPNPEGLLRNGNTGRIVLRTNEQNVYKIPLLATYEVQDKIFIGLVNRQNKVIRLALKDYIRSGNFYLLRSGFKPGDRIIANELASIPENSVINPKAFK
ncbi:MULTISPECIES: efflux RND transporter periplasmic adaptor subunit [Chryseobacterium]|uniref:Membrane fusion protein (Multidrug efflux system) n=1 Tax=Chryseobacterium camelliae TaxID=1265445 RepID=A0ABU0TI63_9FLAO|nr:MULTISPECIES: efflux RND transporter periplasmic adaptor subunit [Chryseobacterium]MDT3409390.1 membrane fusion protein (multidrug efflux system) [Pseudacidovorax intermedius]MDQ1096745.1 membrane fusion protein (multidrug efflux system) [Chryseobacterium camelliae]MDQ1100688.1 membrane fusion protein (multidrug efflux system) [Chryseobacterium sp. SORGH_AS_1048]MDR6088026.1 membrane fusion protein (multidrug efflux system) [Chryseobacterium sp. SORGH_AS_0909]MDR6132401.1 membrane fusion pr